MSALLQAPRSAHADEDELSFHTQVYYGFAAVGDEDASEATDTVDYLGVGARATYATNNWYAYELHLSFNQPARSVEFTSDENNPVFRRMSWARLDAGVTARLGVRWIPTLHASVGAQPRFMGEGRVIEMGWTRPADAHIGIDLVGTVGAGFDYRHPSMGDHWVVGVSVMAQHSIVSSVSTYRAVTAMMHVGYYRYWFPWSEI
jgi:hypothetical protein